MEVEFKFQPVSFSWVALHPEPKGVVQFIGGAFFGTFPTVFYRYFLRKVFEQGYTIVALPFRFSFRHWAIAASLFAEQSRLRTELTALAQRSGYQHQIYQDDSCYFWVGHSLGCKYVALLEFLSGDRWQEIVQQCVSAQEAKRIERVIAEIVPSEKLSIKGQPSLLLAPDISNTESAIPIRAVARWLDKLKLGVLPTREQTQCCVASSSLFNLTALVSFEKDTVAGNLGDKDRSEEIQKNSDVLWFFQQLQNRQASLLCQELPGKHLEPVGVQVGPYVVDLNPSDKFIEPIAQRWLERVATEFLSKLRQREQNLS
uniref:DUF1350 family protein n=1 Tax=Trichocoleus desertorum TaxID=1481672 RepID=UPI0025B3DE5D|nr:DUF1350 family protein [Trichocoleus desertorum]